MMLSSIYLSLHYFNLYNLVIRPPIPLCLMMLGVAGGLCSRLDVVNI